MQPDRPQDVTAAPADEAGAPLPEGKLPAALLERLVLPRTGVQRREVVLAAAPGEDAAALDLGGDLCVAASDPITGAGHHAGWLAVHVNCNDVAATGAEPVAVLLTILLPPGSPPAVLEDIMAGAHAAAREVGCQIAGGHTEVTPGLAQPLVVATALGRTPAARLVPSGGARPGDVLLLTKWAGLEGTAILAADCREALARRGVPEAVLDAAAELGRWLSIVPEARVAAGRGARAMHDVTEGGVLGATWEMVTAARQALGQAVGCVIEAAAIPVRDETRAICAAAGVDPLRLIGSGALLVAAPPETAAALQAAWAEAGIPAAAIGRITGDGILRLIDAGGHETELEPPGTDALWVARTRLA
ncbi:AIR synthase related protein [Thermaerobacter marianensis DSM 12885]|uniref:AIR synthase related protein n=1 Tax=Thermaerobacter marianensis (strain ATCC 700841 / DSM 12885 / JCM 10246 / 7p75a) TaxID=644966 RepID=E6SKE6_THEM7|nr:AIR synthase family protein [Thermaerobacter marianensis]ADU50133.1 AIR synthase related protein [Thermaerobacter marianensis DSM 12885]